MLWKEIAKLELLSGSTRIALIEPNRFLNREEPNRRGTDTTRTALRFCFTFLKPNEPKRTAGSLCVCVCVCVCLSVLKSHLAWQILGDQTSWVSWTTESPQFPSQMSACPSPTKNRTRALDGIHQLYFLLNLNPTNQRLRPRSS